MRLKRKYPDGETISSKLPKVYGLPPVNKKNQNCHNCIFYQNGYCSKWEARVRHEYWCKSWKELDKKSIRKSNSLSISHLDQLNLLINPVVERNLFTKTTEFISADGELYIPGSKLYKKYKGKYHIHKFGHICAGQHDMKRLNPERGLGRLPEDKTYRKFVIDVSEQMKIKNNK